MPFIKFKVTAEVEILMRERYEGESERAYAALVQSHIENDVRDTLRMNNRIRVSPNVVRVKRVG
jgi:hypothetical protein